MTYEEKLEKVLSKLTEERKLTRKGYKTKVFFNDSSFTKLRIGEVSKILLQLHHDEQALSIIKATSPLERVHPDIVTDDDKSDGYWERVDQITVELDEKYDNWISNRLARQRSTLNKLDYYNFLRVYDVLIDIDKRSKITQSNNVVLKLFDVVNFPELLPDRSGDADAYIEGKILAIEYLEKTGFVESFTVYPDNLSSTMRVIFDITMLDSLLLRCEAIYRAFQQKKSVPRNDAKPAISIEYVDFIFSVTGKLPVRFTKGKFPSLLLEMLFKNSGKQIDYDRAYKKIDKIDYFDAAKREQIKARKKFFTTCQRITQRIANAVGLMDFLKYTEYSVEINEKYRPLLALPGATKS